MRKSRERSRSARGCLEGLGPGQFLPCMHERSTTHPRASRNCVRRSGKSWRSRRLRSGLRSWLSDAPRACMPLFIGGIVVGARGMRALWRRWDLLDRLAGDRDAYTIAEVRVLGSPHNASRSSPGEGRVGGGLPSARRPSTDTRSLGSRLRERAGMSPEYRVRPAPPRLFVVKLVRQRARRPATRVAVPFRPVVRSGAQATDAHVR